MVTCLPTCARMAGVSDALGAELEALATNQGGLGFGSLQTELARHGWVVTVSPEMSSLRAFVAMQQQLQAGKAVIARVSNVTAKGIEDHAVLVRSLDKTSTGWKVLINDPATGKTFELDQLSWAQANSGQSTVFTTLER